MISLFEPSHQTDGLIQRIERAWSEILETGRFVSGEYVERFEESFARACETQHAVGVSNGTVALELSLRALGVGQGDEVIVPTNSFIATAEAVSNAGAMPVFVDVEVDTASIDLDSVSRAIGPQTVGVIGVHLYGTPFDVRRMRDLCDLHGLFMIEDAAQAHLAVVDQKPVGGFGELGTFSFYPGKNLGAPGEGGMILSDDHGLIERVRAMRNHGQIYKNVSKWIGSNSRMVEMAAVVLELKLPLLHEWNERRRYLASHYDKLISSIPQASVLEQPGWGTPVHHLYTVEVENRDSVMAAMRGHGVETGVHYPTPIHLQEAYSDRSNGPGSLPVSEERARRVLSLPMHPNLTVSDVEKVVDSMLQVVDTRT